MQQSKRYFMFEMPAEDLANKISGYSVNFFANTIDGVVLMANDTQAECLGINFGGDLIGRRVSELILEEETKVVMANNMITINSDVPQLFYETVLSKKECLSIKTRLLDGCNRVIGTGGIAFFPDQVTFKDIAILINKLVGLHSVANMARYNYVSNTHRFGKLSGRERECIYYLTRGMTYKEIAKVLKISSRTVEIHIEHIKNKLGCRSRSDIVSMVLEYKISATV